MNPADRIRRLVEEGTIAREEGDRLLTAMGTAQSRSSILVNPFERFGGGTAIALGVIIAALSLGVARFGVRFDGFLDLHVGDHAIPWRTAILDQIAAWPISGLLFFVYARAMSKHVRVRDFMGMVGLARLPLLLAALPVALLAHRLSTSTEKMTPALAAMLAISLGCIVWNVTLLYQGFKNSSGLAGKKLIVGFMAMVAVCEVVSKVFLSFST